MKTTSLKISNTTPDCSIKCYNQVRCHFMLLTPFHYFFLIMGSWCLIPIIIIILLLQDKALIEALSKNNHEDIEKSIKNGANEKLQYLVSKD